MHSDNEPLDQPVNEKEEDQACHFIKIIDEELYDTSQTARILKKQPTTLRNSRHSGMLSGVTGPAFSKIGPRAYYRGRTLKAWLSQFTEQTSTRVA